MDCPILIDYLKAFCVSSPWYTGLNRERYIKYQAFGIIVFDRVLNKEYERVL